MTGYIEIEFDDGLPEREARWFTQAIAHYALNFPQAKGAGASLDTDYALELPVEEKAA
jgi:hypothetical protein